MFRRAQKTWVLSAPDAPKTAFYAHWRTNKAMYYSVFQAMPQPDLGDQRADYMRIITQTYVNDYIRNAQTPPVQRGKRELGSPEGDMLHSDWVKAEPDSPDSCKASFSFAEHVQQPADHTHEHGLVAVKQELVDTYEPAVKRMRV